MRWPRVWRPRSVALNHELSDSFLAPRAFGPFRVLHQIGVGVLGPVYRAQSEADGALVAIKALRLDTPPEHAADVARELADLAAAWPRPAGLATLIAAGLEGETPWLALEHLESPTLDTWLREGRRPRVEAALAGITTLAAAIDAAHDRDLLHGSLHPRDVFVDAQGAAKATGFGLAVILAHIGIRPPVRRPYSAPETIAGAPLAPAADRFAFGVLAFEWLTGRRPSGLGAEAAAHFEAAGADEGLEHARTVVAAMLAEAPEHRPGSAMACARALTQALIGSSADDFVRTTPSAPPPEEALRLFATQGTLWQAPAAGDSWREPVTDSLDADLPLASAERASAGDTIISSPHDDTVIHVLPAVTLADYPPEEPALAPVPHDEPLPEPVVAKPPPREEPIHEAPEPAIEPPRLSPNSVFGRMPERVPEPRAESTAPAAVVVALTLTLGLAVGGATGFLLGQRSANRAQEHAAAVPPSDEPRLASDPASTPLPAAPSEPPPVVQDAAPATPASAARSRPPAVSGELVVRSMPTRAAVVVDNVWKGRTPLTLKNLAFGTHTVRVVEKGYEPETRRVSLDARVPEATVSVQLERSAPQRQAAQPAPMPGATTGSLFIESRPTGASVTIDGRLVGTTPLLVSDLAPGAKAIRLEHANHRAWTTMVAIAAGQRQRVAASLEEGSQ